MKEGGSIGRILMIEFGEQDSPAFGRTGGFYLPQWRGSQHRDLKLGAVGASGLCQMSLAAFSVRGNSLSNKSVVCMEICKGLSYNFDVGSI